MCIYLLNFGAAGFHIAPLNVNCSSAYTQQQIMKDRWMNVGHDDEELKPYIEPQPDYKDPKRTGQHHSNATVWKRGGVDVSGADGGGWGLRPRWVMIG